MVNDHVIDRILPKWRSEFKRFIDTGQASEEFLRFVDTNLECQEALDEILAAQSASLDAIRRGAVYDGSRLALVDQPAPPRLARWKALQPYALAASLLCLLLGGVVIWNVAAVGRAEALRSAALEDRTAQALRARDLAEQKAATYRERFETLAQNRGNSTSTPPGGRWAGSQDRPDQGREAAGQLAVMGRKLLEANSALAADATLLRKRDETIRGLRADLRRAYGTAAETRSALAEYRRANELADMAARILQESPGTVQALALQPRESAASAFQGQIVISALFDPVTGHAMGSEIKPTVYVSGGTQLPEVRRAAFRPSEGDGKPGRCEFVLDLAPRTEDTSRGVHGSVATPGHHGGRGPAPAAAAPASASPAATAGPPPPNG